MTKESIGVCTLSGDHSSISCDFKDTKSLGALQSQMVGVHDGNTIFVQDIRGGFLGNTLIPATVTAIVVGVICLGIKS